MPIIIGGPPSSGSSLLSVILNRHSKIACLQETHLLAKGSLFSEWTTEKVKIKKGKLSSPGWHQYANIDLPLPILDSFDACLDTSESVTAFASRYFLNIAKNQDKELWGEKTPANVYFFHEIDAQLTDCTFILTIRHPYDIIASLVNRGKSILDAVALCLLNMGIGYVQSLHHKINVLKYEALVQSPKGSIKKLCTQLELDFENAMLDASDKPMVTMEGWKHHEDGPIKSDSINRFMDLTVAQQEQILHLCQFIVINPDHLTKYKVKFPEAIANQISLNYLIDKYDYQQNIQSSSVVYKPGLSLDRLIRMMKAHPSSKPYPIIYHHSTKNK